MEIYEDGIQIGTLETEENGLYTVFRCACEPSEKIRRVYLAYPYGSKYIGLADRNGNFQTQIPRKQIPKDICAVAGTRPKDGYLPWRGELDGVWIDSALISENEIAMPLNEAMKFPAWEMDITEIDNTQMALVPLSADGMPLPREREAEENETLDFDDYDAGDLADLPADERIGEQGWEADRADL